MIGASSSFQSDLDALNFKYDAYLFDEQMQRDYYKQSRGYKIAWNWSRAKEGFFPFWERVVEDRREKAVYRIVRSYDSLFLEELASGGTSKFKASAILSTASYWLNGGAFYINYYENAKRATKDIVFGINANGVQTSYRDSIQIEAAIRRLIRKCSKWQRIDGNSFNPMLTLSYGIEKNTGVLYLNLIANR